VQGQRTESADRPTSQSLPARPRHADRRSGGLRHFPGLTGWPRRAVALSLSVISLALGTVVAHALWLSTSTQASSVITAGSLAVTLGDMTWQDISADVPVADRQSGTDANLAGYRAMPGDTLELRQVVQPTLVGDNLEAVLMTSWAENFVLPEGASATYIIEDATGQQIAPASGSAPVGTNLSVGTLVPTSGDLTVVVTWHLANTPIWASSIDAAPASGTAVPPLVIDLQQFRGTP
jgi:alternate signal-mediated exported protein